MRLLIVVSLLSLLTYSRHVHAAAFVAYPYRSGEIPVVNSLTHGYVRYVEPQGVGGVQQQQQQQQQHQHFIGYKYTPESVVQSRRITSDEYLQKLVKGSVHKTEAENEKARDEHFRVWSMQVYDQYRQEMELLKSQGKEPTTDQLAKFKTLEDIIVATRRGTTIDETPQTKQLREDHNRIWLGELVRAFAAEGGLGQHAVIAPVKPAISVSVATPAHIAIIGGETAEQKKAREEHFRVYQEQLKRLQEAQAAVAEVAKVSHEQQTAAKDAARAHYNTQHVEQQQQQQQQSAQSAVHVGEGVSHVQETPEVQRAKAEHLRLWQEAKLRAEKEGSNKLDGNQLIQHEQHQTHQHFDAKNIAYSAEKNSLSNEGEQKIQETFNFEQKKPQTEQQLADKSDDTVTVISAAVESGGKYEERLYGQKQQQQQQHQYAVTPTEQAAPTFYPQFPTPVQDTPEVQRARAEHLKIVEDLQKKAQIHSAVQQQQQLQQQQQHLGDIRSVAGGIYQAAVGAQTSQQQYAPAVTSAGEVAGVAAVTTRSLIDIGYQAQAQAQAQAHPQQVHVAPVQDTVEVQRAREEHLKLLKEAHLKASQYQKENAQTAPVTAAPLYQAPAGEKITTPDQAISDEEARLRAEEAKQREAERLAEEARKREEQRLLAEEQLRLQQEEQRRQAQERLEQARLDEQVRLQEQAIEQKKKQDDEYNAERTQLPAGGEESKLMIDQLSQNAVAAAAQTDGTQRAISSAHESQGIHSSYGSHASHDSHGSHVSHVSHDKASSVVADNAHLLRFGGNQLAGSSVPTTAYYLGGVQQSAQKLGAQRIQNYPSVSDGSDYYLRDINDAYLKVDKPYYLQYIPNANQLSGAAAPVHGAAVDAIPLSSALVALSQAQKLDQPILAEKPIAQFIPIASPAAPAIPAIASIAPAKASYAPTTTLAAAPFIPATSTAIASDAATFASPAPLTPIAAAAPLIPIPAYPSNSVATNIEYGTDGGLAALEKATRDHFRAHEIALEQLRLANEKQPTAQAKDCN